MHTDPGILPNENGKWLLEFSGQYSNRQPVYFLNHIPLNITSSIHSITFLPLSWDGNLSCQGVGWIVAKACHSEEWYGNNAVEDMFTFTARKPPL